VSPDPRPWAVIDIDGVLADVRHRLHHLECRPKDWDAFFAAAPDDAALPEGLAMVGTLAGAHELVYLTGRPERCRDDTVAWLARHGLPEARLVMRREGDRRPARQAKLDLLRRLAARRPVAVVVDDDPRVVKAEREAGFTVLHADWMGREDTLFDVQEGGRT
jgi:phosphoglycolate phosphatase-like HAD superfamily hydrolase